MVKRVVATTDFTALAGQKPIRWDLDVTGDLRVLIYESDPRIHWQPEARSWSTLAVFTILTFFLYIHTVFLAWFLDVRSRFDYVTYYYYNPR